MNKRLTVLIIAAVAAILPAAAVADVLITGSVNVTGTPNSPVFKFDIGPNYEQADGYISWHSYSSGQFMGDLHLNLAPNENVLAINVFKIDFGASAAPGVFYFNLTGASAIQFPAGSMIYLSSSLMSFSQFESPYSTSSPAPGITTLPLSIPNGNTVSSGPISVTGGTTLYVGVYLPAGSQGSAEIDAQGQYFSG